MKSFEVSTPLIYGKSFSLDICIGYLGKKVKIVIDQPHGTNYNNLRYECNYIKLLDR